MNSGGKTLSHTGIYTLGNILRNIASLVMLPIYTRYLTPADYGTVELLSMLVDFVSIVVGLRMGEAIFRFYCDSDDPREKGAIISTALWLSGLLNGAGVLILILLSAPLAGWIFGDIGFARYIFLFSFALLTQAFVEVPMLFVRAQQRPWLFLIFSVIKLGLQVSLNVYFVVVRQMHVEGVIYSALISSVTMALILSGYTVAAAGARFSVAVARKLVSFSLPIMLSTIGAFYLTFGDRYIIRVFTDLTEVGIYSLAYKFGFMLFFFTWDPFSKIWDSQKYEIHRRADAVAVYQRVFVFLSLFMTTSALIVALFVKDLLVVMSDPAFVDAYRIVPIVLLAYIVQAWTFYANFGILLKGNTLQIAYAEGVAVVAITVAYFSLIPLWGGVGAAVATVIGFGTRLYFVHERARREYDMKLPWATAAALLLWAAAVYALSLFAPAAFWMSVLIRTALFGVFVAGVLWLPVLAARDRELLRSVLRAPAKFRSALRA